MSIQEHDEWDSSVKFDRADDNYIEFEIKQYTAFSKQNALVMAKHFNQDRESLVSAIKELDLIAILGLACLELIPTNSELALDLDLARNELQNLINPTNKLTKEEVDNE